VVEEKYPLAIDPNINVLVRGLRLQHPNLFAIVAHKIGSTATRLRRAQFQNTSSNRLQFSSGSLFKQARFYSSLALHAAVTMTSSGCLDVPEPRASFMASFPMRVVFTSCTNYN
jgi:hypothetical protein